MPINQDIENINKLYKTGNAREHFYRGDLQALINAIVTDVLVTNEPVRIECGASNTLLPSGIFQSVISKPKNCNPYTPSEETKSP